MNIKLLSALLLFVTIHVEFSWAKEEIAKDEFSISVNNNMANLRTNSMAAEEFFQLDCKDTVLNLDNLGFASLNPEDLIINPNFEGSLFLSQSEFSCADIGDITQVTVTVIDTTGNNEQCTSNVEVVDNISPVIVCPGNIVISTSADSCNAHVTVPPFSAIDNCSIANLVNDYNNTPDPSGIYPIGVNTVTITATDGSGNSASCIFSITVIDSTFNVTCNLDIVQNNDSGLCQGFVLVPPPIITTCSEDSISITNNINQGDNASGIYPVGNTTVTWTISGELIETENCEQIITIMDVEAPSVTCKNYALGLNPQGTAILNPDDVVESSSDNCGIFSFELDKTEFSVDDIGENQVTVTAEDLSGNLAVCLSIVSVLSSDPPTAICNNITVALDENGFAAVNPDEIDGGSFPVDEITSMIPSPDGLTCDDIGVNEVTLTITNEIGLSSSCAAEVTIVDTLAPNVVCKNASMTEKDFWNTTYALKAINNESSDNCAITNITLIRNSDEGNDQPVSASITITGYDLSGNKSTCKVDVTIIEQECNTTFTIYPNPSAGAFKLTNHGIDGNYQIELINDLGKIVYRDYFELLEHEEIIINPYQLKSGLYVVKLTNTDKSCYHTSRIVIQR